VTNSTGLCYSLRGHCTPKNLESNAEFLNKNPKEQLVSAK